MDGISAAANIIALATALKDLVELEEKVRSSLGKVKKNRESLLYLAAELSKAIELFGSLVRKQSDLFDLPVFQDALNQFEHELTYLYDRCERLWSKNSGLGGMRRFIKAWRGSVKIEEEIHKIEKGVNACYQRFMIQAMARIFYNSEEQKIRSDISDIEESRCTNSEIRDEELFQELAGINQSDKPKLKAAFQQASKKVLLEDISRVETYLNLKIQKLLEPSGQKLLMDVTEGVKLEQLFAKSTGSSLKEAPKESREESPYRSLSDSDSDESTWIPISPVISSEDVYDLYGQALQLLKSQYNKEALVVMKEVLDQYNSLAEPKSSSHLVNLRKYLHTYGDCFHALGRNAEAEEQWKKEIEILHTLVRDFHREYDHYLAVAQVTLSSHMREMKKYEEAFQYGINGLGILRRTLANNSSGPSIPRVLIRLVHLCLDLNRNKEALEYGIEAAEKMKVLVLGDPDTYSTELPYYLLFLARCFSRMDCHQEASDTANEAKQIYRSFVYQYSDDRKAEIIERLLQHSKFFSKSGSDRAALTCNQLAVDIRRVFASFDSETSDPKFSLSLHSLSRCLFKVGNTEMALEAIREALCIHEHLKGRHPEKLYEEQLAADLMWLVQMLCNGKQYSRALVPAKRMADTYRHLAQDHPSSSNSEALKCALQHVLDCLRALKRVEEIRLIEEEIRTSHSESNRS